MMATNISVALQLGQIPRARGQFFGQVDKLKKNPLKTTFRLGQIFQLGQANLAKWPNGQEKSLDKLATQPSPQKHASDGNTHNERKLPEMDETIVTVETWNGPRTWRRTGLRDHVTRDGRKIQLAVWEGTCTICGGSFNVATPKSVFSAQGSNSFLLAACPAHKLTPTEIAKISFANKDERLAIFEAIKREKLNSTIESSPC